MDKYRYRWIHITHGYREGLAGVQVRTGRLLLDGNRKIRKDRKPTKETQDRLEDLLRDNPDHVSIAFADDGVFINFQPDNAAVRLKNV